MAKESTAGIGGWLREKAHWIEGAQLVVGLAP